MKILNETEMQQLAVVELAVYREDLYKAGYPQDELDRVQTIIEDKKEKAIRRFLAISRGEE